MATVAPDVKRSPLVVVAWVICGLLALYLLIVIKRSVWDRVKFLTLGHRVRRQVRTSTRSDASFARTLRQLDPALVEQNTLPMTLWSMLRREATPEVNAVSTLVILASIVLICIGTWLSRRGSGEPVAAPV